MSESEIQKEIMKYLKSLPDSKTLRLNSQGTIIRGRIMKSKDTLPDILFLYRALAYFFEIKTPTEKDFITKHYERLLEGSFSDSNKDLKRYKAQIEILNEIKATGNHASFVSSVEDVKLALQD